MKNEILATIERRFQFVIILGLFLPSVWDNLMARSPQLYESLVHNSISYVFTAITATFVSYLLVEFAGESLRERTLSRVAKLLLLISFALVSTIAYASGPSSLIISDWKFILLGLLLLGNLFLPMVIIGVIAPDSIKVYLRSLNAKK